MDDGTRITDIGIDAVLRPPTRNGADILADHVRSPGLRLIGAIPAFELKFVLDESLAEKVTRWCSARMQPDPHGDPALGGLYRTTTLYLDTAAFDIVHGVGAFRWHKYRLRRYGHEPWVFAERKRKAGDRVRKRRATIAGADVARLADASSPAQSWAGAGFRRLVQRLCLRPACLIGYERRAFIGVVAEGPVRLTLDHHLRGQRWNEWIVADHADGVPLLQAQVVCELKFQNGLPLLFKQLLAELQLVARSASKYCLAVQACAAQTPGVTA
jgi:hypothetical protein